MSMSTTAPGRMVDVKEEDVVAEGMFKSEIELSFTAQEKYQVLKQAMKYVCMVYKIPFQGLLEAL